MEDFILGLMLTPEIYDSSTIYEIWSVRLELFLFYSINDKQINMVYVFVVQCM